MRKLIRSTLWGIAFTAGIKSERARILSEVNKWLNSGAGDLSQTLEKIRKGK